MDNRLDAKLLRAEHERNLYNTEKMIVYSGNTIAPQMSIHTPKPITMGSFGYYSYYSEIAKYDWNVGVAYAIMMAESGGNPEEINWKDNHRVCNGSFGLFQMACVHIGKYGLISENINTPEANVRAAYLLYKQRGWSPWGAYTNKSYLAFL
jgi:hypothetical protein